MTDLSTMTTSKELMQTFIERVNNNLKHYYDPSNNLLAAPLNRAMFYSRRRLRASFVYASAGMFGREFDQVVDNVAMAYEIITANYVLLDDTVIMDSGEMRADMPTPRIEYGEVDALLSAAILQLEPLRLLPQDPLALRDVFYEAARDTILGLKFEEDLVNRQEAVVDEEEIVYVARWLTGPLLYGPLVSGAMLAGANEDQIKVLKEYAFAFGTAYQLTDHIIDVMAAEGNSGKDGFSDILTGKRTLVINHALNTATEEQFEYLRDILGTMPNEEQKRWLQRLFIETGAVNRTFEVIKKFNQDAVRNLQVLPDSAYRDMLMDIPRQYVQTLMDFIAE